MIQKEELTTKLKNLVSNIMALIRSGEWSINNPDHKNMWEDMVKSAVELHKIVKPKHHRYMIENRGCSPDAPEFYDHIHPVQDLLKFIDDPHANDDPEDVTIGHSFSLVVYSRRWGHEDRYTIVRNEKGWVISNISIGGQCDKAGRPYLFENLDHDSINYPEELPGYFDWLWQQAEEEGLSHEQVQEALNQVGGWITLCERNSPRGIWEGFK